MALSENERVRYARQLLLPELSDSAHERVLSAEFSLGQAADVRVAEAFALYATRAGVAARGRTETPRALVLPSTSELSSIAGYADREPAIALLIGALAATRAVLEAAGVSAGGSLSDQIFVVSEDV